MRTTSVLTFSLVLSLLTFRETAGRPRNTIEPRPIERGIPGLRSAPGSLEDTVMFGGTFFAADSLRWEAIRDSVWTFDTGVASSINNGSKFNKPVGYHEVMEGWRGIDRTRNEGLFRRSSQCALIGSFSLWAGLTQAEASSRCYVSGQGYGNGWNAGMQKTFFHPGSGSVNLAYSYAVDTETGYDELLVAVDTTGTGSEDAVIIASYSGLAAGAGNHSLVPGATLRSGPGPISIRFIAMSDDSYSDEDGLDPSVCGHSVVDNVLLSGAVSDFSNFETGLQAWAQLIPTGTGDFSDLRNLNDLPPPFGLSCSMSDSVLLFADQLEGHPAGQDNIAASPWINLTRNGETGKAGRILTFDGYVDLPMVNYVYIQAGAQWYPHLCPDLQIRVSPLTPGGTLLRFANQPECSTAETPFQVDLSDVVPSAAEQVRVYLGVMNLCAFSLDCTGVTNTTPWFDNVRFGVFDPPPPAFQLVNVTATGPHVADGVDASLISVTVVDTLGVPVSDADVVVEVGPCSFARQLTHWTCRSEATHAGSGVYETTVRCPVPGQYVVSAYDRNSGRGGVALLEFLPPPPSRVSGFLSHGVLEPQAEPDPADEMKNCKNFFTELDRQTLYLDERIKEAKDAGDKKKQEELEKRKEDLFTKVFPTVESSVQLKGQEEKRKSNGVPAATEDEKKKKEDIDKKKKDDKDAWTNISTVQKDLIEKFFGKPVDITKFQACMEKFNNFKNVEDFDKAIDHLTGGKGTLPGGPDASIAHLRWAAFAMCAIDMNIDADFWSKILPTLLKGSKITINVLSDNDPGKPGKQPKMQDEAALQALRTEFDALRPSDTDTPAQKQAKKDMLKEKYCAMIKEVVVEEKTVAQLPGKGTNGRMTAMISLPACDSGRESLLSPMVQSRINLNLSGADLFGLCVDDGCHPALLMGTIAGDTAKFVGTGFGLSPGGGPCLTVYTGVIADSTITGTLTGGSLGFLAGEADTCLWTGTFVLELSPDVLSGTANHPRHGMRVSPPWPNPLRGERAVFSIVIDLASDETLTLDLLDVAGRRVARREDRVSGAGPHTIVWDAGSLSSGLYFVRVHGQRAGAFTRKLVILN